MSTQTNRINYVSSVALPGQWVESDLRGYMDNFKNNGLTLYNLMYVVGADIILARPNRDEEINKTSNPSKSQVAAASRMEYNWYVDRLTDGYFEVEGRRFWHHWF
ncbi:MAG: hypothetical protein IPP42_22960 [Saprospiraceae bacterium]|nr:hypothetical protein [Saprospiraceae bacterium]